MVAFVCQRNPNAIPSMLVSRLFKLYSEWKWPKPIMLCEIDKDAKFACSVWDPVKSFSDSKHLMPIITPGYPSLNCGFNVSPSTLRVMTKQFQFGKDKMEEIELNKLDWSSLFEPYMFFEAYKNYIQVDILALNREDLLKWKSWVVSRFRKLSIMIEQQTFGKLMCHPHPNEYVDTSRESLHCSIFMGLKKAKGVDSKKWGRFDIRGTIDNFKAELKSSMYWEKNFDLEFSQVLRENLPSFVFTNGARRHPQFGRGNQQGGKHVEVGNVVERCAKRKSIEMVDATVEDYKKRLRILECKLRNQQSGKPAEVGNVVERCAKRKSDEMMDASSEKPEKRARLLQTMPQNQQDEIPVKIGTEVENNNEVMDVGAENPEKQAPPWHLEPQIQQGGIPAESGTVVERCAKRKRNEMMDASLEKPHKQARLLQAMPQNQQDEIPVNVGTVVERLPNNNNNEVMDAGAENPEKQAPTWQSEPQIQQGGIPTESGTVVKRCAKRKNNNELMDTKPERPEKRARLSSQSNVITNDWIPPVCNQIETQNVNTDIAGDDCNPNSEQTIEVDSMANEECEVADDSSDVVKCESGQEKNSDNDFEVSNKVIYEHILKAEP